MLSCIYIYIYISLNKFGFYWYLQGNSTAVKTDYVTFYHIVLREAIWNQNSF